MSLPICVSAGNFSISGDNINDFAEIINTFAENEPFEQKTDIKAALQHLIVLISPQPYPYVYLPITFVSMMTVPEHCRILF